MEGNEASATAKIQTTPTKKRKAPVLGTHHVPAPPPKEDLWPKGARALTRSVFPNRTLNMGEIEAIGYDMDYTLAQYRPESFELLVYNKTKEKLVKALGYPEVILELEFDWRFMVRGLTIDKKRGNILKMDRHKFVKVAYHGFSELSREMRLEEYHFTTRNERFDGSHYGHVDTLFSLAETYLYAQLVDLKDEGNGCLLDRQSYSDIYGHLRKAVDLVHREGSLKQTVAAEPEKFIHRDEGLKAMLIRQRRTKKLFIATNSLWDYTNVVMNFVLENKKGKEKDHRWLKYFDLVVTGTAKPGFFEEKSRPMFEVNRATGMLMNTDNGTTLVPIGHHASPLEPENVEITPILPKVEEGGESLASVYQGGSEILYVGDHIYGDILHSKKSLGWRTMLVVPELDHELTIARKLADYPPKLAALRENMRRLEDAISRLDWQLEEPSEEDEESLRHKKKKKAEELASATREHKKEISYYHSQFHTIWGQLMKCGTQNSRFASQVEQYACLYSSHVSNLGGYSNNKIFRSREDDLPHEAIISAEINPK